MYNDAIIRELVKRPDEGIVFKFLANPTRLLDDG
jgi:hypothetical protein